MAFGLSAGAIALIGAGATVAGGVMASKSAKSAANTQANSAEAATLAQREMFDKQIELQEPWRQAGGLGLNALLQGLGLSQDGTFEPAGAPRRATSGGTLVQQPDGTYTAPAQPAPVRGGKTPASAPAAPVETMEQIRARLSPQFTTPGAIKVALSDGNEEQRDPETVDTAKLEAAVQAEMKRMQGPAQTGTVNTPPIASAPPGYGNMLQDFQAKTYKPQTFDMKTFTEADFKVDPGYAFRQEEGERAINRGASAAGRYNSGRVLRDLTRFNSGLASQEYGAAYDRFGQDQNNLLRTFAMNEANRSGAFNMNETNRYNVFTGNRDSKFNKLAALSGVGQTTSAQLSGAAGNYGAAVAGNTIGAGNARAAGQVGAANAISGGIGQAINGYQQNQLLQRFAPQATSTSMYGATPRGYTVPTYPGAEY